MKTILYAILLFILLGMAGCSEDFVGQTPTDGDAPSPITSVDVNPLPGGAEISYALSNESDVSYVKGIYYVKGIEHVERASVYNNVLRIEGLGSTDPVDVTLYVVDHSENLSSPYVVTIHPLTPLVDLILSSMQMQADFGGVNVTWTNEQQSEIGITIMASNEDGEMEDGETYYNQLKDGDYTFRGYDDQPRIFAFYLTDKWGNVSDTITQELTPLYEDILDKKIIKKINLPLDNNTNLSGSYTFAKMFDDNVSTMWHTTERDGIFPVYFTVDLGMEVQLSRFKLYHRSGNNWFYKHYNPKTFEVWGCTSYKDGMMDEYWSEDWKTDWKQLGDFVTFKPSGEGSTVTNEDIEYAQNGFEYMAPLSFGKVRYLRFVVKSTWGGAPYLHIAELTFWGNNKIE